jgi:Pin2-interacting protein X1
LLFQDKSTTGKQGLGIKDRTKKVAGCYFQGTKTSFGNSDDEDSADIDSLENETDDEVEMVVEKVEKIVEPKMKLKKLCKQILNQVRPIFRVAYFSP